VRLQQQWLEDTLVRLNLALQLKILLRPAPRLLWIRLNVIKVDARAVRPQNGSP
jgi:hypothetical protein